MKESILKEKQESVTGTIGNCLRLRRIIVLLFVCSVIGANAQESKDVTTCRESYFLKLGDVANSLELLPTPPEQSSTRFKYDEERY